MPMDLTLVKHTCSKPRFCTVSVHLEEGKDTIFYVLFPADLRFESED
jgi:hypothetical protein